MSIDFMSIQPVAFDQLVCAGKQCDISIEEGTDGQYAMIWDVGDYEAYAERLSKSTKKAFRECIEPIGGRFILKRPFWLDSEGTFHYSVYGLSGKCTDDLGIAHRLMEAVGVELICTDEFLDKVEDELGPNVK